MRSNTHNINGWKKIRLSNYGETYSGLSGKTKDDFGSGKPYISYLNIFENTKVNDSNLSYVRIGEDEKQTNVKKGDMFFTTSSESPDEVGMTSVYIGNEEEIYLNSVCFGYRLKDESLISTNYLTQYFRSDFGRKIMYKLAQGATRYNLSKSNLLKEPLLIPQYSEQVNISNILEKWDKGIEIIKKLIPQLEERNKWLANKLLTGKRRFPEFNLNKETHKTKVGELPKDWEVKYISKVIKRVRNSFTPELDESYQEIGIRSHTKGIFYKEPVTGKSLGNKSVFWIEPNCFIVNIVFAWEHAVAKTTEQENGMIASHRFPMYKPKEKILNLDYLLYFFKSQRGKHLLGLASPGGAGRNKTLGQSEFMKLQIPIPSIEEQQKIVSFLAKSDRELDILRQKLEKLKELKKGLMQQLLTGKIRLNINN